MQERTLDAVRRLPLENGQEKNVTANTTLATSDTVVRAIIPLTGTLTITLPPVGSSAGMDYFVYGKRAEGTYVDGKAVVVGQSDGLVAFTSGELKNNGHFTFVKNGGGKVFAEIAKYTT